MIFSQIIIDELKTFLANTDKEVVTTNDLRQVLNNIIDKVEARKDALSEF